MMGHDIGDGFTARYVHERVYVQKVRDFHFPRGLGWVSVLSPTGGRTHCMILDPDGTQVAHGIATCRPDEHYKKAFGRMIALARAHDERDGAAMKRESGHQRRKRHDEEREEGSRLSVKNAQEARKVRKAAKK